MPMASSAPIFCGFANVSVVGAGRARQRVRA